MSTFAQPWAFWFLTLGLPIVALHLYRGRRRRVAVPYLRLWEASLREAPHRSALGRLRHLVSLLLNLTLLAILCLTLARPSGPAGEQDPDAGTRPLAMVIDATLGMRAREAGGRRFDLARQEAKRLARAARGPVRLYCAGRGAEAARDAAGDREAWTRWLDAREPRGQSGTLVPALDAASAWLNGQGGGRLVLITDGATRDEPGLAAAAAKAGAGVRLVGTPLPNLAMVEGRVSRVWGERRAEIFFRVRNCSDQTRDCTIAATLDDRASRNFTFALAPGASQAVPFPLEVDDEARLTIKALADDALPEDNAVRMVVPPRRRPRVFVFQRGGGNAFLRDALEVLGDRLNAAESRAATPEAWEDVAPSLRPDDVVIFDGCGPSTPPRPAGYLFFKGRGPHAPREAGAVESPASPAWSRSPIARDLPEIGALRVREASIYRPGPGQEMVLDSAAGVLAVSGDETAAGIRFVAVGFRIEDSNFALQPAFPVFLRNAFAWLAGEEVRHLPAIHPLGVPLTSRRPLPAAAGAEARLLPWGDGGGASGPALRLPLQAGMFFGNALDAPGFYRFEAGDVREWTAVNFLNEGESDLRPEPLAGVSVTAVETGRRPWVWTAEAVLVALALTLLAADWWLFQRGVI